MGKRPTEAEPDKKEHTGRAGEEMPQTVTEPNWWVLVTVGVGTFMSALDGSVVNIILPVLTRDLHSSVAAIEWVVTVYLLVIGGVLLGFGRWGDLHGHKKVYMAGFVIFVIGSALCGLSPSAFALVGFRGLQGIGAAMLFSSSPAILTENFPPQQRGQALGLQATMTYLGLTVGPLLGGWLTDHFSWRAVFYINVPIGMLALGMSWRFIPKDVRPRQSRGFDVVGATVFLLGLVALMLALDQGHAWGWASAPTLGLLGFSGVLLTGFILLESRVQDPMLDLSLFRRRLFSAAAASSLLNYISLFSALFLLPFYLMQGRGFSPGYAGVVLTALPLPMTAAAPVSGWLSDRIGTRIPGTLGMAILTCGLYLLSRIDARTPIWQVALSLGVAGLGTGIFISPNNSALMGAAPRDRQGIAAGVLATARIIGNVVGIGLAGAIFNSVVAHALVHHSGNGLFAGMHWGALVASGVAALGALTSFVRGKQERNASGD